MIDSIRSRRSIRKYLTKDVPDNLITQILDSARHAPSGSNTQPWRFLVIRDNDKKEEIARINNDQKWMLTAPVFIVCAADIRSRITDDISIDLDENCSLPELKLIIRDTAIAVEHILLEADELGLASCWTAWFNQHDMKKAVDAPAQFYISGVITIGYAAETPPMRPRKNLSDIVSYEKWL